MDLNLAANRACPKCGSGEYAFRGRKKVGPEPGQAEAVETTYRCKACAHEWRERLPTKAAG